MFAVVFGFTAWNGAARRSVSFAFLYVTSPVLRASSAIRDWSDGGFSFFRGKNSLADENTKLKERNAELESRFAAFDILQRENSELKAGFGRIKNKTRILASVISRPPQSPYDVLILDAGAEQGVQKDMLATAYGEIILGRVEEVFGNTSRVKMISHSGSETQVLIFPSSTSNVSANNLENSMASSTDSSADLAVKNVEKMKGIAATAIGLGGANLEIKLPSSVEIKSGDIVMTEGIFPLTVGAVEKIERYLSDPFQKLIFRLPVNVQEITSVVLVNEVR